MSLLVVSTLSSFSCQLVSHRDAAQELAELTQAIDALRDAPNADKTLLLQRLRQVSCSRFCALKDRCVAAYQQHVEGVARTAEVREGLLAGSNPGALDALDRAEGELTRARQMTSECAGTEAEAQRTLEGRR